MADRLQWLLELQDRISTPATRMERQLDRVRAQLKSLDIQAKTSALDKITDPIKRQRAELQLQRDKLLLSKAAMDKTSSSTGSFVRQLHDVLHIAQIVGGALERMAGSLRNVAKAISFRESSLIGLQTFLGAGAGGMFDRLTDFAARTGRSAEEMVGLAKSLAMAGVAAKDIEPILKRVAGLNNISAGSGDTVAKVIGNIFSTGKGTAGDVEALRGTPIKVEKVYEDIAQKLTGARNRVAGKMIAENEFGLGKNFLTSLILGEADQLGASGKAFAGGATLQGRLDAVAAQMDRTFGRLAKSSGVTAFKGVLKNLADALNPDTATGQKTLARLADLSNAIAQALDPLTGPEGRVRMEAFFESLTKLLKGVIPLLEKAAQFTEILVGSAAGGRAPNAPKSVGEELEQFWTWSKSLFTRNERPAYLRSPFEQFQQPVVHFTQHIDARGSSRDDAQHIADMAAQRAKEALTDELVRWQTTVGGSEP